MNTLAAYLIYVTGCKASTHNILHIYSERWVFVCHVIHQGLPGMFAKYLSRYIYLTVPFWLLCPPNIKQKRCANQLVGQTVVEPYHNVLHSNEKIGHHSLVTLPCPGTATGIHKASAPVAQHEFRYTRLRGVWSTGYIIYK